MCPFLFCLVETSSKLFISILNGLLVGSEHVTNEYFSGMLLYFSTQLIRPLDH